MECHPGRQEFTLGRVMILAQSGEILVNRSNEKKMDIGLILKPPESPLAREKEKFTKWMMCQLDTAWL